MTLYIVSKTCSVVRERVLLFLMLVLSAITALSIVIHYSSANNTITGNMFPISDVETIVGKEFTFSIQAESLEPVNAFAGTLHFDPKMLAIKEINYQSGIVDLWIETPSSDNKTGTIRYSGGITKVSGFMGKGNLFTVTAVPLSSGTTTLNLSERQMLKSDGHGTAVILEPITSTIIKINAQGNNPPIKPKDLNSKSAKSADLNGDHQYTFGDFGVYAEYSKVNDLRADFNNDQHINQTDFDLLMSKIKEAKTN